MFLGVLGFNWVETTKHFPDSFWLQVLAGCRSSPAAFRTIQVIRAGGAWRISQHMPPTFISQKTVIWKGSHNLFGLGDENEPCLLTTYRTWNDLPNVGGRKHDETYQRADRM